MKINTLEILLENYGLNNNIIREILFLKNLRDV